MADLTEAIKSAALQAVNASKPCIVHFGTVTALSPLEVLVDQRLRLSGNSLVVCASLTSATTEIPLNSNTSENTHEHEIEDGTGDYTQPDTHSHELTGSLSVVVRQALSVGDSVLLLRMQGGDRYVILDRVV